MMNLEKTCQREVTTIRAKKQKDQIKYAGQLLKYSFIFNLIISTFIHLFSIKYFHIV